MIFHLGKKHSKFTVLYLYHRFHSRMCITVGICILYMFMCICMWYCVRTRQTALNFCVFGQNANIILYYSKTTRTRNDENGCVRCNDARERGAYRQVQRRVLKDITFDKDGEHHCDLIPTILLWKTLIGFSEYFADGLCFCM